MKDHVSSPWTRREFINTSLCAGYALAVMPVLASAVHTSANELDTGDVSIPLGSEKLPAYFARPKKTGKHPCVLVIHEVFGVHEYIRDVCRRLAAEGYFAVTVDLYSRYGDATKMTDFKKIAEEILSKTSQKQIFMDLDATVNWLSKEKSADAKRIGITGFCWGGNITWMYAAHNPNLKAGVAWYGKLRGVIASGEQKLPLDIAETLKVPVLGLYGAKDESIPLESVHEMQSRLKKGKSASDIIVYPDADHAFHADYRATYHKATAKKAWSELLKWFRAKV
jgi:carboxymethylenebutenolidase